LRKRKYREKGKVWFQKSSRGKGRDSGKTGEKGGPIKSLGNDRVSKSLSITKILNQGNNRESKKEEEMFTDKLLPRSGKKKKNKEAGQATKKFDGRSS